MSKVNRIVATRSFENAVKQLKKKHESKTLKELKQTVLELANYNITKQKSNHPLKNSDGHIDLHLKGGKLVLLYKYEDDVLTVSLRLQDVVNHDQLMSYDTKKYKAPAREYDADNISSSTILCSYDEFITWYDNLSDEEQWKVDDIADTNGIPFYEEASDDELAWLHDVATIEIHASADTVEAIGLLEDNTVYSSVESSDYESDSGIFIEDIIDSLEDNGYDLSRIRSIRQGLLELFGYKGKDADIIIHDLIAGGFIDPNNWVDKDYIPGIYSATDDGEGYWFFTTHGVQPGSVPKDVDILDIIDTPNGSFVKFDRFLSTEELNEYDMKERAPKSVMSSESEERRAEDNPWVQEIDWVMSQLPSWFEVNGSNLEYDVTYDDQTVHVEFFLFDGAKYTYYIDGHGPYTTNQSERIGSDIEDYINRNFEDIMSATEEEYDEEELQDIIDELTADGFDVTDEADLLMGLGADLGMDRADARYYAKLILNHIDDSSVLGAEEDEDSLPMVDQEYDSAATSINSNKLPAIYRMINLEPGKLYLDFGGGKFDNGIEYVKDKGATLVVYDPYNRSAEHNKEVLRILRENGGADAAINSNVLNVIKEPEARKNVLENIARITKPGAPIYITVYEGKGNGQEGPTKSGYQLNRKTADYLEEIQEVFPDATRKGKLITAHNSGAVTSSWYDTEIIDRYDKDVVDYQLIARKQIYDNDGFSTDYAVYVVYLDDGSVEYECYHGDSDLYGPWNGEGLDFESENDDEAVEWYNSYASDEIESSESIEADAFSSLEDQYLSPPEYDDPVEHEASQELIEVELDQVITVDVDGDYEWDDDTYVWASPDESNEEWRSEDGVFIDDKVGVVEHIDDLIIPNVPIRPGKYKVTGLAKLVYDVSGIQEYRTEYGPDDYESDLDIDHAVVSFNFRKSEVRNLKITPVRR